MKRPRPRILLVTRNMPPLVGGMERLNWHLAVELLRYADVQAIGPEGSARTAPPGLEIREVPIKPLWRFLLAAQWQALCIARRWKPEVVLAGSGLNAPAALMAARASDARAAVYVHGLDLAVSHPVYKALWLPALRRMDRVIANSRPTAELATRVGIKPERIGIVHPGVDLPPVAESRAPGASANAEGKSPDAASFRRRHHFGNRPLLLSVGRLSARKGLREFVSNALPSITASHPDATLLVVGDAPNDALHAQPQTPQSITVAAQCAGVADNVRFLGTITDYAELGTVYRAADVHVFPVREIPSDPEGFGMVAVEAAAHGLPTVAFATGGVVDAVAEGKSGHLVAPGEYARFAEAVLHTLDNGDALRASCLTFAQQFAWPMFGAQIAGQLSHVDQRFAAQDGSI